MIQLFKNYIEKRLQLFKIDAAEKTFKTIGTVFPFLMIAVFGLFFLFLLNLGAGLLIGKALNNYGSGFLILAGFYFGLMLLTYLLRKRLKNLIVNKAIQKIYPHSKTKT